MSNKSETKVYRYTGKQIANSGKFSDVWSKDFVLVILGTSNKYTIEEARQKLTEYRKGDAR